MSLDKIADEIAAAAKKEADAIIAAAEEEAASLISAAEEEGSAIRDGRETKANREAAQLSMELVASARQANQKRLLIARREELDLTHEALVDQMGSAKMKGRSALLKSLVAKAKKEASKKMVLRPVGIDRTTLEKEASGMKIGEDIDGLGGFVLESDDGAISLDFRFDGILDTAWHTKLGEVSSTLFE